jgi:hypothetical protein
MAGMRRVYLFGIALCIANFVAFVLIASHIGGDAINGYAANGHYYLRNHAIFTEVSRPVFLYSKWHAISLLVTHPFGIFSGWMLERQRKAGLIPAG